MNNHEKTLFLYTRALDEGDLDTLSQIYEEATQDALLFKKLLELDQVHQQEIDMTILTIPQQPARILRLHPRRVIYRVAVLLFVLMGAGVIFWGSQNPDDHITTQIISPLTTPEATPTMVPDEQRAVISTDNIAQLTQFAQVGTGIINGVLWLGDNEHFLMYGSLGISIYDKSDLKTPVQVIPTDFAIQTAQLSPDGEVLATGGFDGVLRGIEIASGTGKIVYEYKLYERASFWEMDFDPTGTLIANGNSGEGVRIVDLSKGRQIWIENNLASFQSLQFSPDGSLLAIGDWDNIRLIDIHNDQKAATLFAPDFGITAMIFSPDGERIYASSSDSKIYYWELNPLVNKLEPNGSIGANSMVTAFVGNATGIWGLRLDQNTPLFSLDTAKFGIEKLPRIPDEHLFPSLQWYMDVNPLNEAVFYTTTDLYLYDLANAQVLASTHVTDSIDFWSLAIDQQGNVFLYNRVNVYQLNPNTLEITPFLDDFSYIRSITLVPNQSWIAINRDTDNYTNPRLEFWDTQKHTLVQTFDKRDFMNHLLITNDGKALISTNYGGALALYNLADNTMTGITHGLSLRQIAGNPTQPMIAFIGFESRSIKLYNYAQKTRLPDLQGHAQPVLALEFSPDGSLLASTDEQNIILWDTTTWEEIAYLPSVGGYEVAFSPDGSLLAVVQENLIQILNMQTWQVVAEFPAHRSAISGIGFTPDGKLLVSSSFDGTVLLWGVPTE